MSNKSSCDKSNNCRDYLSNFCLQECGYRKKGRNEELDSKWKEMMPCSNCTYKDMCRHADVISRPNYNKDVFDISIVCKIKPTLPERVEPLYKEGTEKEFVGL